MYTRVCECMSVHSLVWNDLKDQVVQQCELFGYLQGRMALKGLGLRVLHRLNTNKQENILPQLKYLLQDTWKVQESRGFYFEKAFVWSSLTICVISSRVTWLSPGSS